MGVRLSTRSCTEWQEDFLKQASHFIPTLLLMLESDQCETMDNASVILQKLSRKSTFQDELRENTRLLTRLNELSRMQSQCFGGGGDASMDAFGVSEFLILNVQSTLKTLT